MTIKYNVTGAKRKQLVKSIAEWLDVQPKYLGAPSFAYEIDYFTVDKEGTLSFDDRADSDVIEQLLEHLNDEGFEFEAPNATDDDKVDGISISMPASSVPLYKMGRLVAFKKPLFEQAFGKNDFSLKDEGDKIVFSWFPYTEDPDEIKAYEQFVVALCKFTNSLKWVNYNTKPVENAKYSFRCFLLRLGFIGDEYKTTRKILLRNLEGSSAFKGGRKNAEDNA